VLTLRLNMVHTRGSHFKPVVQDAAEGLPGAHTGLQCHTSSSTPEVQDAAEAGRGRTVGDVDGVRGGEMSAGPDGGACLRTDSGQSPVGVQGSVLSVAGSAGTFSPCLWKSRAQRVPTVGLCEPCRLD
jgi:hypothetical protein